MTTTPFTATIPDAQSKPPEYGSVEYYSEQFSDVLADVGEDDTAKANVLKGFLDALASWQNLHDMAACRYEDFAVELNNMVQVLSHE